MTRPCDCGHCHLCDLAEKDPRYRRLWGLDQSPDPTAETTTDAAAQGEDLPCGHRGETLGEVICNFCGAKNRRIALFACQKFGGRCTPVKWATGQKEPVCLSCPERDEGLGIRDQGLGKKDDSQSPIPNPQSLILRSNLCPGDILTMTAAVYALHQRWPGRYRTDVRTPCPAIWEHNPHITPIADGEGREIGVGYPSIHRSNQTPAAFLDGYREDLAAKLGVEIPPATNRPMLYLSADEQSWINQVCQNFTGGRAMPFWLVSAGVKKDYPAKQWPIEHYQGVVNRTRGRIQWVQIGDREHDHPELAGVIQLVGQTDHRQLIRLAWHAQGGLGPVTYLQHLMAAWEKPYVCLLGGREPANWVQYPMQHTLHTIGTLPCCRQAACWKSRVVPSDAADPKHQSLCERPVLGLARPVAQCMAAIRPDEVVSCLRRIAAR